MILHNLGFKQKHNTVLEIWGKKIVTMVLKKKIQPESWIESFLLYD